MSIEVRRCFSATAPQLRFGTSSRAVPPLWGVPSKKDRLRPLILKYIQKVLGGLMIMPAVIAASVNTIWPEALRIGGSTTGSFSTGAMAIIGIERFGLMAP